MGDREFEPPTSTDGFFYILDKYWSQLGHSFGIMNPRLNSYRIENKNALDSKFGLPHGGDGFDSLLLHYISLFWLQATLATIRRFKALSVIWGEVYPNLGSIGISFWI